MKCYYHIKEDAIAVCKSCGRAVCSNCLVSISGNSYCKECVEAGRVQLQPVKTSPMIKPMPTPSGIPSRTTFIIGSVGLIIAGVAGILSLFGGLGFFWLWGRSGFGAIGWTSSIMLGVGALLAAEGYKGMKTNYGRSIGTVGFVFGDIAGVFFIIEAALMIMMTYSNNYYYYYYGYYGYDPFFVFFAIFTIITIIMFAVAQIIWGVAHINSREYTGNSGLGVAAGILLIISGAFSASLLLSFIGFILFLVGAILAVINLLMAKIPQHEP